MTSPSDGGSRRPAPAARGVRRFGGVWAPIVLKLAGIVFGMLALAAIGASSIARGSGVAEPVGSLRPVTGVLAMGVLSGATGSDAGAHDAGGEVDAGKPETPGLTADGKVILNVAGPAELCRLPGVGAKRAEAIIALRTRLGGRFKRVSDLLRVKGIGVRSLKKIEPHVVLDSPAPSVDRNEDGKAPPASASAATASSSPPAP